jgi:hypothetical protein
MTAHTSPHLAAYELNSLGDIARTHWFCSRECRAEFTIHHSGTTIRLGSDGEAINGAACGSCGKALGEGISSPCAHNAMIPHDEPGRAWKCADCGYVYGDVQHPPPFRNNEQGKGAA